jgi:hypothetical protein
MSDPVSDSERLRSLVEFQGTEVTSKDIDAYSKYQDIGHKEKKLDTVLKAWTAQEDEYRKARKRYANCILGALLVQGIVVNVAFFLIGNKKIEVDPWVANSFILGVFAEMATLSLVVFKYFFPSSPSSLVSLVEKT